MEDREILENLKKDLISLINKKDGFVIERDKREKEVKALENILKENENLKQSAIINKNLYEEVCNKNKELEEEKCR